MMPGWLSYGDLPPAGNHLVLEDGANPPLQFKGFTAHWVQSGTAALALALLCARRQQPQLAKPTVILPAYGCPDLIAAAEYAGLRPVLVDIGVDDPGYDLDQLAQAIDASTVAVVAVNFLGIRERLPELRAIVEQHAQVALIEDNAQWLPEPIDGAALQGDMVCLSFGRGKPVGLLGGGLLLVRNDRAYDVPELLPAQESNASLRLKFALFNALLQRRLYALVNRNPLFELGLTRFKPLVEIRALDQLRRAALPAAVAHYIQLPRAAESLWRSAIAQLDVIDELAVEPQRRARLLRYPVLVRGAPAHAVLWRQLDRAGLGVTAMYRNALPEVAGVAGKFALFRDYPQARAFAARLLTLPVHAQVNADDIARAAVIIAGCAQR